MRVQDFVRETISEIIAGVQEAQRYAVTAGARINPIERREGRSKPTASGPKGEHVPIGEVDFDVAVTSTDTMGKEAGAGIIVAALGIGAKVKSDTLNRLVSRIKFSVPIALPVQGNE